MWRSLVLLILVGSQLSADTARDAALRQDLNTLARQIVQTHPNPFTRVTAEAFSQQVQRWMTRFRRFPTHWFSRE